MPSHKYGYKHELPVEMFDDTEMRDAVFAWLRRQVVTGAAKSGYACVAEPVVQYELLPESTTRVGKISIILPARYELRCIAEVTSAS